MTTPSHLQQRSTELIQLARDNDIPAMMELIIRQPGLLPDLVAALAYLAADATEVPGLDRPWNSRAHTRCPTCDGPQRETVNLICQTCGRDYGRPWYT